MARAWSCARFPGVAAAATVSGQELVARALPATPLGSFAEDAADDVLKEVERYRVVVRRARASAATQSAQAAACRIVAEANVPIVIDADALNAVAVDPAALRVRHAAGLPIAVLTPHAGEYERLAGQPVGADRVGVGARARAASCSDRVAEGTGHGDRRPRGARR